MILTFADSGLLIAAGRGIGDAAVDAIALLGTANREFASSFYIMMETLPKGQYHKRSDESALYQAYFAKVKTWLTTGMQSTKRQRNKPNSME